MKLEDQVVSLELSKKLKELGFKQESLFTYVDEDVVSWKLQYTSNITDSTYEHFGDSYFISAYTVAELGEELPDYLDFPNRGGYAWLEIVKIDNAWCAMYRIGASKPEIEIEGKTLASAMAKMLIYLKKNKLI